MRFARVEAGGTNHWAQLHDDTVQLLDQAPWDGGTFTGTQLSRDATQLVAPVAPSKIFCLGRNYAAHRAAMGYESNSTPSVFMKGPTTIIGPGGQIVLPPEQLTTHVEHEAELAVVIGATARSVQAAEADRYIFGYTCANDVSARDLHRSDPHPTRAKGFDTFCPVGPWIETEFDLDTPTAIRCSVNGELRQDGSTADMMHSVGEIIQFVTGFATLLPGDLVLTGSPGGTGPIHAGDRIDITIDGVGTLTNYVA